MHKQPSRRDDAQNARRIVEAAIGEPLTEHKPDPHFKELGRLGGLKGGKARAKKLSTSERREIAKKAASARWSKHR